MDYAKESLRLHEEWKGKIMFLSGLYAHIISCDFDKDNNAKICMVIHA